MKLLIAVLLAILVFALLVFTAVWARHQELKNSLARKALLAQKRLFALGEFKAKWPEKNLPTFGGDSCEAVEAFDQALFALASELRSKLESTTELTNDPVLMASYLQMVKLEDEANSARVNYAGAVKSYNRIVDCAPTRFVARWMGLKKVPRPHIN